MGNTCSEGCFAAKELKAVSLSSRSSTTPKGCEKGCCGKELRDPRVKELKALEADLKHLISTLNCNPILVRLAWHDSGTFDQRIQSWPQCGGANGAIRFDPEMSFGANAGLAKAKGYLDKFAEKYPSVSWADMIQMASAVSIEAAGGPKIPMKYGRVAVTSPDQCVGSTSREGFAGNAGLPDPLAGPDGKFPCGATAPAAHLRNVFTKKMGFTDQEIVALSGAHTIGLVFKERSGTCRARRDASSSSGPVMQHDTYVTIDTIMMCMQ